MRLQMGDHDDIAVGIDEAEFAVGIVERVGDRARVQTLRPELGMHRADVGTIDIEEDGLLARDDGFRSPGEHQLRSVRSQRYPGKLLLAGRRETSDADESEL